MSKDAERPLFDLGLQLERTALSWRRTSLSIAIASLIIARLTTDEPSAITLLITFVGLTYAATLVILSHHRYRLNHLKLIQAENGRPALGGAWLLGGLALAVSAISIGGLAYVILRSSIPSIPTLIP